MFAPARGVRERMAPWYDEGMRSQKPTAILMSSSFNGNGQRVRLPSQLETKIWSGSHPLDDDDVVNRAVEAFW